MVLRPNFSIRSKTARIFTYKKYAISLTSNLFLAPRHLADGRLDIQTNVPFGFCSQVTSDIIQNIKISIARTPIPISNGKMLEIDVSLDLLKPMESGSRVSLRLSKKMLFFWLPVPCLNVSG